MRFRSLMTATATVALAAGVLAAPASAGAGGPTPVSVVHGIPGAKVDVCVGKMAVRENFRYGQHFQAPLPPGAYPIRVRLAGHGACTGPVVIRQTVLVPGNENVTVVAVVKGGTPQLEIYVNDMSALGVPGDATVSAIHEARAPRVDVWIASPLSLVGAPSPTVPDVDRGDDVGPVALPADAYAVWVSLAGTVAPVIGPAVVELSGDRAFQVVAVGTKLRNYRLVTLDLGPLPPR